MQILRVFKGFQSLAVLFGFAWVTSVAIMATDNSQDQKQSTASTIQATEGIILPTANRTAEQESENYVGKSKCLECHKKQEARLADTLHGQSVDLRTPASRGEGLCETCHGPGKIHSVSSLKTDIKSFKVLPASTANATCLSCHANRTTHINWAGSKHDARNVSCVSCHTVHHSVSESFQLKTVRATDTCVSCHKQQALKIRKSSHMPLTEGKMECTSCHSPHGSTNVRMLRVGNTINESCVSCHTEKRGPFLNEHAPVANNCVTCHDPHGSNNDRLLVAKVPMLCQRCHVPSRHPATIYDGAQLAAASNRILGRGCINCHQQIHGSNNPAGYYWHR